MAPATTMRWRVRRIGDDDEIDRGELALSGLPLTMKVAYRPAPELPGESPPAGPEVNDPPTPTGSDAPANTDGDTGVMASAPAE